MKKFIWIFLISAPLWAAVLFDPSMIFWTHDTQNTDGSPLTDLAGMILSCSFIEGDQSSPVFIFDVADPSINAIDILASLPVVNGQRYFCTAQSYNDFYAQFRTVGISDPSNELEWELTDGGVSVTTPKAPVLDVQ